MPSSIDTFIAGCAGGMAQVLAGQPFDMVKVRLQAGNSTAAAYHNMSDCLTKIIKNEGGPCALWKGSLPPLMSVGAAVSIQFSVNERTKSFVRRMTGLSKLSLFQYFGCGTIAGFANSIVAIPTEHSRIRMQVQAKESSNAFKGSIDCVKKIAQQYGLKGLYKGGVPTVMREMSAFGLYFSFYEYFVSKMLRPDQKRADLKMAKVALAGGLTGMAVWLFTFPIDVIKTKIQVDSLSNPFYKGTLDCVKKTYKSGGLASFYKGFSPCILRSIPANGATFMAYETASQLLTYTRERILSGSYWI